MPELKRYLADDEYLCVFPSEIAAEYWRRHGVRLSDRRAVRTDRFVSWDTFKERYLSIGSTLVPANRVARRLFAAELCDEIHDKPSLPTIVPPQHSRNAHRFARTIAGMVPSLKFLIDEVRSGVFHLEREARADFEELYARYRRFLQSHRLFDPSYLDVDPS